MTEVRESDLSVLMAEQEITEMLYVIRGRYHDQWSCRDGAWRIDHRHFTTDLCHVAPMNHELMQVNASAPAE